MLHRDQCIYHRKAFKLSDHILRIPVARLNCDSKKRICAYLEILIIELLSVYGLSTRAIAFGEIASLAHEVGNDTCDTRWQSTNGMEFGKRSLPDIPSLSGDDTFSPRPPNT